MGNTPEKILGAALKLFNEKGMAQVTLRQIAAEVGISQGNLNYHFQKREDLVHKLFDRFYDEIEELVQSKLNEKDFDFGSVGLFLADVMDLFYNYRFIFLDFAQLMRDYEDIRQRYLKHVENRLDQFEALFNRLSSDGVFKQEDYPGQYRSMYKRIQILTDFWFSFKEIKSGNSREEIIRDYVNMVMQEVYPHLTKESQAAVMTQLNQS